MDYLKQIFHLLRLPGYGTASNNAEVRTWWLILFQCLTEEDQHTILGVPDTDSSLLLTPKVTPSTRVTPRYDSEWSYFFAQREAINTHPVIREELPGSDSSPLSAPRCRPRDFTPKCTVTGKTPRSALSMGWWHVIQSPSRAAAAGGGQRTGAGWPWLSDGGRKLEGRAGSMTSVKSTCPRKAPQNTDDMNDFFGVREWDEWKREILKVRDVILRNAKNAKNRCPRMAP